MISWRRATCHVLDDIREEAATVLSYRMIRDDPFDRVGSFVAILRVELLAELPILPFPRWGHCHGDGVGLIGELKEWGLTRETSSQSEE